MTVDRRVTLKWMFGAMAASGVPVSGAYAAQAPVWPQASPAPVAAPGYGTDPTLMEPIVPWPKTLTEAQLKTTAALCDTILPAEGKWPHRARRHRTVHRRMDQRAYPEQAATGLLLNGSQWVEAEASLGTERLRCAPTGTRCDLTTAARVTQRRPLRGGMKFLTTGAIHQRAGHRETAMSASRHRR